MQAGRWSADAVRAGEASLEERARDPVESV